MTLRPDRTDWHPATIELVGELVAGLGSEVATDSRLAAFTTYRVGGPAAGFIEVESVAVLERIRTVRAKVADTHNYRVPVLVVGRGSNLLVADRGFDGLVIKLGASFDEIVIDAAPGDAARGSERTVRVRAGGGALLPVVARKTAAAGLTGFEWAVGVPGSVGGAVRMNAGGHGSDMAASLLRVSVFDLDAGGPEEWSTEQLNLGYRSSSVGSHHLVLFAELALLPGDREVANQTLADIVRWRRDHQPGGANAGSVFANPEGDSAGRLVEAAGLKGFRLGTAVVSEKHANFIQVDAEGSADDVFALIQHVRAVVVNTSGVDLRPENLTVGFESEHP